MFSKAPFRGPSPQEDITGSARDLGPWLAFPFEPVVDGLVHASIRASRILFATALAIFARATPCAIWSAAMAAVTVASAGSMFTKEASFVIVRTMARATPPRTVTQVGSRRETRTRLTALMVVVALLVPVRGRLFGFFRRESPGRDAKLPSPRPLEAGRHALLALRGAELLSRRPLKDSRRATLAARLAKLSSSDAKKTSSGAAAPEWCAKEAERRPFLLERAWLPPEREAP